MFDGLPLLVELGNRLFEIGSGLAWGETGFATGAGAGLLFITGDIWLRIGSGAMYRWVIGSDGKFLGTI